MTPGIIFSVINAVSSLGGKFIEDKDKRNEFAFKTQELLFKALEMLLNTTTVPWVDALVKLMVASVTLARPIGSFALTCIGVYCHIKNYQVPDTVLYMLDGAFPAWGTARQYDKGKQRKQQLPAVNEDW